MSDIFDQLAYFQHTAHDYEGTRSWQVSTLHAGAGDYRALVRAEIPGIPAEVAICDARSGEIRLRLQPRPMFLVRGAFEVLDQRGGECIGVLKRDGAILDATDRALGAIADPASFMTRLKEGALNAAVDVALSIAGGSAGHVAQQLEIRAGDVRVGGCRSTELPFTPVSPTDGRGFSLQKKLAGVLPARAAALLDRALRPSGWKVEFVPGTEPLLDPRLRVAAVVLSLELERWRRAC